MKRAVLMILCLSFLSGCASIVSGGPELVTINSTPTDAKMTICNDRTGQCITIGQTPYTATLDRSQGFFTSARYSIKCEKDGFEPSVRTLQAGMNGWYVGNIVFGGLIGLLIVDPATGAMWDIKEHNIVMNLSQKGSSPEEYKFTPEAAILREDKDLESL